MVMTFTSVLTDVQCSYSAAVVLGGGLTGLCYRFYLINVIMLIL